MFFKNRKRKYKRLPIEYYIAISIGFLIGYIFPTYFNITSKVFLFFSICFFISFSYMYVFCMKGIRKEYLIKEENNQDNK